MGGGIDFDARSNDDGFRDQRFSLHEQTIQQKILTFYINDPIDEPKYYTEMIHRIKTAGPNDEVYININTPGGNLTTGIQMINAMSVSQARVVTVLEAEASSMGAILFLAGDEFIIHENCIMMFHHYSGTVMGKGHEQLSQVAAAVDWYSTLLRNICQPFLTDNEVERILKGEDLYFDSPEIKSRLVKLANEAFNATKKPLPKKASKKKTSK